MGIWASDQSECHSKPPRGFNGHPQSILSSSSLASRNRERYPIPLDMLAQSRDKHYKHSLPMSAGSTKLETDMSKFYIVRVNDVPSIYPSNYFPREFRYKKAAIAVAKLAIDNGASMARVECPNGGELDYRPTAKKK